MIVDFGYTRGMYRIRLTTAQHQELRRRTRARGLPPSTRDRLEMVRLSDAGWSVPRIARHLGQHEQTVRAGIKAFLAGGFDALPNLPRGGGHSAFTPALIAATQAMIRASGQTWTARQVAAWLATEHGVTLSPSRVRFHLRRAGLSYHRTSQRLTHKQDPAAGAAFADAAAASKKKRRPG
jgi:putative transposase